MTPREKARQQKTFTISVTEVKDPLAGMMAARILFGWTQAESREKFSNLPLVVLTSDDEAVVSKTYKTLSEAGMEMSFHIVNDLGEDMSGSMGWNKEFVRERLGKKKCALVDLFGAYFIQRSFKSFSKFSDGVAIVERDGKYGLVDEYGREVTRFIYKSISLCDEYYIVENKDGEYGFIDKTGKEVVKCQYDSADSFSEGLACVKKNDKYGFIDKAGKEVVKCRYDDANVFHGGTSCVCHDGKWYLLNTDGSEKEIACKFLYYAEDGMYGMWENNKLGFVDSSGNVIVPYKYKFELEDFSEGDDFYDYDYPDFENGYIVIDDDAERILLDKYGNELVLHIQM